MRPYLKNTHHKKGQVEWLKWWSLPSKQEASPSELKPGDGYQGLWQDPTLLRSFP
jgi:hypothetical protein